MLELIVNADDFGFSEKTNEGIVKTYKRGIVTSTSIMANGEAFEHAIELAKKNPDLDLGIHLTLVGEKQILPLNKVPSLVNNEGEFLQHARSFAWRYFLGGINYDEVRAECDLQISTVLSCGLQISHIDSHQHVHMLPRILDIVMELSDKYDIPFIRFPREYFTFFKDNKSQLSKVAKVRFLNFLCSVSRRKFSSTADYFTGFYFDGDLDKKNLRVILENLPESGVCELMCHPGEEEKHGNLSYHTSVETETLTNQEILNFISEKKIRLTSFKKLSLQKCVY